MRRQFRRPHQVVVNVPELLTAGEGGDQFQVLIKRILSLLTAGDFATVPQAIRRLEKGQTRQKHIKPLSMTKTCRGSQKCKFFSRGTYLKSMMSRRNHDIFGLDLFLTDSTFLVAVTGQPANHKKCQKCHVSNSTLRLQKVLWLSVL